MKSNRLRSWALTSTVICATLLVGRNGELSAQIINPSAAGVVIDAQGVLHVKQYADPYGQLSRQRLEQVRAAIDADLARPSKMRKVSLNRLEAAIAENLKNKVGLTDEMKYLAGLTSIRYVFCYPETKEIVIAGPAEGFMEAVPGRVVGIESHRSVLELQDLIVALRAFPPTGQKTDVIGCSIDPSPDGLAQMQEFLQQLQRRGVRPNDGEMIANGLKESLGDHEVSIQGISPKTHFAQVLVEADYRMKLIGIGLERPPVKMNTFIQKASPAAVSRNALQRWYFVPDYESVRVSEDGYAMELIGEGVKLISENEMITADGGRVQTTRADYASEAFANSFTANYSKIAEISPIYAQLRNLIDLSVAAAYIQQEGFYEATGWDMPIFANEDQMPVETYAEPVSVDSAVNVVWKGNTMMTPIGGGVHIEPTEALDPSRVKSDERGALDKSRYSAVTAEVPQGTWWWD